MLDVLRSLFPNARLPSDRRVLAGTAVFSSPCATTLLYGAGTDSADSFTNVKSLAFVKCFTSNVSQLLFCLLLVVLSDMNKIYFSMPFFISSSNTYEMFMWVLHLLYVLPRVFL